MRVRAEMAMALIACALNAAPSRAYEIIALTNNETYDLTPRISGTNVVWTASYSNFDSEIWMFDGATAFALTDSETRETNPDVSGSRVVWQVEDGDDHEIVLFDGVTATTLTDGAEDLAPFNYSPAIDGDEVVWIRDFFSADPILCHSFVGHFDGATTNTQIGCAEEVAVSNSRIAFFDDDPYIPTVYLRLDGGDSIPVTSYLWLSDVAISGSTVVWSGRPFQDPGSDYEIFLWNGVAPVAITANDVNDESPAISGSNVVWQSWDGHDWEIWFFDGNRYRRVTNNQTDDVSPAISGFDVVWQGYDGHDTEIYKTTVPEAANHALFICALAALAALHRSRRRATAFPARFRGF